ncbi:hypothetical protein EVAR_30552_1 [Eumeta japonica]|uniref:Uncharacterized protein n=1 Tax=Eumeta variegata TaxID=151549 RepID=A0A4C1VPA0_EUMVA|nr:hypothetical protein EVAR_30552_1 [Eumeta japonica]
MTNVSRHRRAPHARDNASTEIRTSTHIHAVPARPPSQIVSPQGPVKGAYYLSLSQFRSGVGHSSCYSVDLSFRLRPYRSRFGDNPPDPCKLRLICYTAGSLVWIMF